MKTTMTALTILMTLSSLSTFAARGNTIVGKLEQSGNAFIVQDPILKIGKDEFEIIASMSAARGICTSFGARAKLVNYNSVSTSFGREMAEIWESNAGYSIFSNTVYYEKIKETVCLRENGKGNTLIGKLEESGNAFIVKNPRLKIGTKTFELVNDPTTAQGVCTSFGRNSRSTSFASSDFSSEDKRASLDEGNGSFEISEGGIHSLGKVYCQR